MTGQSLPARDEVTVQFAHSAYRLAERFEARGTGVAHFQTSTLDDTLARVGAADASSFRASQGQIAADMARAIDRASRNR